MSPVFRFRHLLHSNMPTASVGMAPGTPVLIIRRSLTAGY